MRIRYHHILPILLLSVIDLSTVRAQAPAATPTLWIIGDSTVKNGTKGLRGWGEEIGAFFDSTKITVQNRALGGRSSRTYFTEGLWAKVADQIKPGDYLLMQFGHNDGGKVSGELSPGRPARASLKGTGEDTQVADVGTTGQKETVHSYGWYLRQFIEGAKAKGATPIVLSPVPRDDWKDGKVLRSTDYGKWASDVATSENVPFIDLNGIIADQYDQLGQDKVKTFFPFEHTHTSAEGAQLNAKSVIKGIQGLGIPLKDFIAANPPATTTDLAPSVAK